MVLIQELIFLVLSGWNCHDFCNCANNNYYTATKYPPVNKIAKASQTGHATNIIAGLGVGNMATGLPVALICVAIWISHSLAGLYGISIAVWQC